MRVLLIEDDPLTAKSIEMFLASEGIVCDSVKLGQDGINVATMCSYDIIILDLMLPDIDGFDVLMRLRSFKVRTPVMIVSGLAGVGDKLKALNMGGDDYITKPFHKNEFVARINAIVRRSKGHSQSIIKVGGLSINLDTRLVEVAGKNIHLTGKEYAILELLAMRRPAVIQKETLLSHLYLTDEPEIKIIDVFVCKLRKKLKSIDGHNYIDTVWGRGYSLKSSDEEIPVKDPMRAINSSNTGLLKNNNSYYNNTHDEYQSTDDSSYDNRMSVYDDNSDKDLYINENKQFFENRERTQEQPSRMYQGESADGMIGSRIQNRFNSNTDEKYRGDNYNYFKPKNESERRDFQEKKKPELV